MKTHNSIQNKTNEKIENPTIIFDQIAPHPEPVAIDELLTEIEETIKKHVVLSDAAATALAVWVLHTYVYELRDTVAYVAIESPEKRCGKTTLLSVLAAMANKPLIASNVTVGALFRAIDTCRPTLFIDEADTFLAGSGTMRGIINSGNTWRTAYVLRLSRSKLKSQPNNAAAPAEGAENSGLQRYSCWCPKVIAMIGKVPDTIADRSIVVPMTRKLTTETRAPLAELEPANIKAKCARFALDECQNVRQCEKIRGDGLNDRAADTFDPLYVIARLAGNEWEQKLHTAALALANSAQSRSSGTELLLDIHAIFAVTGQERMFTRDLLEVLRDERCSLGSLALKYSAIDEYRISQLLRPYGIRPRTFRIETQLGKGYACDDFNDAIVRYLPTADVAARVQEMRNQAKLMFEAKAEQDAYWGRKN